MTVVRGVFRVAAGPRLGFGHLVRVLNLAEALGGRHCVSLRGSETAGRVARRLGARVVRGSARDVIRRDDADVLVIDDPSAAACIPWIQAARRAGKPVVALHDLGLGAPEADLHVDASIVCRRSYGGRALLGPRYAVLSPRLPGLRRRLGRARDVRRVVVSLGGGTRRAGALARLSSAMAALTPQLRVLVATGFAGGRAPGDHRVEPISPRRLLRVLGAADLAVVGGGVTAYEACALGIPAVAVPVVPAQRATVDGLTRRGCVYGARMGDGHSTGSVLDAVRRLIDAPALRRTLSCTARGVVDGRGAQRVAAAIARLVDESR